MYSVVRGVIIIAVTVMFAIGVHSLFDMVMDTWRRRRQRTIISQYRDGLISRGQAISRLATVWQIPVSFARVLLSNLVDREKRKENKEEDD